MAFWPVPRYLVLATRQVLGMEQEGHIGDEGGDQVNEVLSGAHGGRRRLLKLQGPRGAFPGLAQLDGPAHHLWVRLGEQKGGGLGGRVCPITLLAPIPGSFPSPSPSHKVFVPGSKSISCPARPQDIQNRGEMQIQGRGGGGCPQPVTSTCLPSWMRMRMPVSTIFLHLTDQSWKGRYWHFLSKKRRSFS